MSLYLNYPLELQKEKVEVAAWSNTDIPVLAVGTSKKRITFFQDDSYNLTEHDMKKDAVVTAMAWHPSDMIMSYGLQTGHVGLWIDEENYTKEELNHEGKITILRFNYDGNRIISACDKGTINVWRFPPLCCMCTYKQSVAIDDIIIPHFCIEKMNQTKAPKPEKLATLFFFSNAAGILYLADDAKSSPEICRVSGKIKSILFYERDNAIILITSNLLLVRCSIHFQAQLVPKKVKLSIAGNPDEIKCCWASEGLIGIVSGDDIVRFYYLETDQGYFLGEHNLGDKENEDSFTCIDFSPRKRTLIVGGNKGKIYMWKCNLTANIIPVSSDAWQKTCVIDALPNLRYIKWSLFGGLIHSITQDKQHSILSETVLQRKSNKHMKIYQKSQKEIEIVTELEGTYVSKLVELDHNAKGIEIYELNLLIWTGTVAYLYEVDLSTITINRRATFKLNSNLLSLNEDSIIAASTKGIDIYSYQGELKENINLSSRCGEFLFFYTIGKYLLVVTTNNYFGIYDISRRTPKEFLSLRKFEKNGEELGEIRDAAMNNKANLIIFLLDNLVNSEMRVPETKFIIFDIELDTFIDYEISPNVIPIEIIWDTIEPRVFGIRTEYARELADDNQIFKEDDPLAVQNKTGDTWFGPEFYMLFYASESGVRHLEKHKIQNEIQGVFGLEMPNIYFIVDHIDAKTKSNLFIRKFQFFLGLEEIDDQTRQALCDFTLLMACGKLDEAYKTVKNVKSDNIWENMAKICIQTKRVDVLEVCLSNMRFQRGIRAFRESKHEKEPEAILANVAMHLGMIEEAKTLLKEVNRWDVLIHFYICIGEYELAIKTAIEKSRINLNNTYYRIAQHYEDIDDIESAIKYYKLSQCGNREIPRMLINKNQLDLLQEDLELGTTSSKIEGEEGIKNPSLVWRASYYEHKNQMEEAKKAYEKAKDYPNLIRLLLKEDKIEEALKIYETNKETASAYLFGLYYERVNDVKKAILYYGDSGRFNQAFRLAKKYKMDSDIYSLGMRAPKNTQNLVAEYFEKKNEIEKAINLYLLGSNIKKGLNLCLATNQYDKIRDISESLETKSDKDTLKALAEYFMEQEQYEKALGLYIRIKDYTTAMNVCENHKVKITKETANAMVKDMDKEKDGELKIELTLKLAKFLMQQGEFELAHNIYIKNKNLKKAMKCLIKMGDKDRVISFATTCRQAELFILAANFLQNLEWNAEIVKIIQSFYNKAKAYVNLGNFYENYATVLITERKDFKQALEALHQGLATFQKMRDNEEGKTEKVQNITDKIEYAKTFRDGIEKLRQTPLESIPIFKKCLEIKMFEDIIKENDVYNMIFRAYYTGKDFNNAYATLKTMKEKGFKKFAKKEIIMATLKAVKKENEESYFFGK
ncbi:MAG: hypothetical protein MJ252_06360 [archaeon]|nr:hypothetical protein [archaeon]